MSTAFSLMKLWIKKNSEIPVRTQIVLQVRVAIASGDLRPGDKLPSTREIARRFGVHANTVSAAYRELAFGGMVELRKGSGIYIREGGIDRLDVLLERLLRDAADAGFSKDDVLERLSDGAGKPKKGRFLLFEPNEDLAKIIDHEIYSATGIETERLVDEAVGPGDTLVAMFDEEAEVRDKFGNMDCVFLTPNSVANSLSGRARPSREDLVAVTSGWDDFLNFARLFLLAAGVDDHSICICSTRETDWKRRLESASMVICDSVTATLIPNDRRVVTFPLISETSMRHLRGSRIEPAVAPAISIPSA